MRIPVRVDFAGGWTDVHYFSAREGGSVVNAAINHYVVGTASTEDRAMRVEYGMSIPKGSGLGTSAALDVAWLALTDGLMGRTRAAVDLAEAAYRVEKLLGVEGGKQDQYASALGGFNFLEFGDEDQPAGVEPLRLDPGVVATLEERLVLCYTGAAHHSGELHEAVWARFLNGDSRSASALRRMAATAPAARTALLHGDFDVLADVLTENREAARALHPGLVTPYMDELFEASTKAGAAGGKACGAGGGGCLVFVSRGGRRQAVAEALERAGATVLPFRFEPVSRWGNHAADGD